jgi:uncharacterized glyoxalase superfamily protein PhnB
MPFLFEKLDVYQKAVNFADKICELTKDFAKGNYYLADQLNRTSFNAKGEKEADRVLEEVRKLGATIVKPALKVFWSGYSGYFRDLEGHFYEVAYGPMLEFDENDNLKL